MFQHKYLVVGLTGWFVGVAYRIMFGHGRESQAAAFIFIFLASLHKWSWSANTELFFVFFTIVGLVVLLKAHRWYHFLLFGSIFGCGFLVKYPIAFDLIAFSLYHLLVNKHRLMKGLAELMIAGLGFALPIGSLFVYYTYAGHLSELLYATWVIPNNYPTSFALGKGLAFFGEFYLSYLPLSLLWIWALYRATKAHRKLEGGALLILWTILPWIGVLVTGKLYYHYLFPILLPFSFFTPLIFRQVSDHGLARTFLPYIRPFAICLGITIWVNQYFYLFQMPDYVQEIACEIVQDTGTDRSLYTNYQSILYYLCDTTPPIKYTHSSLLYKEDLIQAYGIDPERAFARIVQSRPRYYVLRGMPPPTLGRSIAADYTLVKVFGEDIRLWRRRL